jgi:hypothetical protein
MITSAKPSWFTSPAELTANPARSLACPPMRVPSDRSAVVARREELHVQRRCRSDTRSPHRMEEMLLGPPNRPSTIPETAARERQRVVRRLPPHNVKVVVGIRSVDHVERRQRERVGMRAPRARWPSNPGMAHASRTSHGPRGVQVHRGSLGPRRRPSMSNRRARDDDDMKSLGPPRYGTRQPSAAVCGVSSPAVADDPGMGGEVRRP